MAGRGAESCNRAARRLRGFTLIELLITVTVVTILLAVAYPSFLDQVRKSRRGDGIAALAAVQQAQERFRSSRPSFTSNLTSAPTAEPAASAGLGLPSASASGYYGIAITAASPTGYVATATAETSRSQAGDGLCAVLAVRMENGNVGYGSGSSAIDWNDPGRCWAR